MKIAIYPGSFDPITNGHLNILERALKVFDKVIILVAINEEKTGRFSYHERVEMIKEATKDMKNVEVDFTDGLTVDFAKKHNASVLIRGLRAVTDFEYESKIASINEQIDSSIDMVFFMSRGETHAVASSKIIEMFKSGQDISHLVPKSVIKALEKADL